jgi:hypothetical protein
MGNHKYSSELLGFFLRPMIKKNQFFQQKGILLELIYNSITAMGFSAMFTFQLDNTEVNIAGTPLPQWEL